MADIDAGDIVFTIRGDASQLEDELNRTQDTLRGTTVGMSGLATAISTISPNASKAIRAAVGMKRAFIGARVAATGLGTSLVALAAPVAVVAAAVAGLALVWREYADDVERANAVAAQAAEVSSAMATAHEGFTAILDKTSAEFDVFSGATTRAEQEITAYNAALNENVLALKREIFARQDSNNTALSQIKALDERTRSAKAQFAEMKRSEQAERDSAEAAKDSAKANRAAAAAASERAAAETARIAAINAGMADMQTNAAILNSEIDQGINELVGNLEGALAEIESFMVRDQEAIEQGISNTLTGVSQLSATLAEQIAEDNSKAAMALFRTSQAAGLADVAINTAIAITKALAQLGPIAGPVAAIGIGTLGAAQAASIAAQSPPAHMGDPLAPDERRVSGRRILATEAVLDSATTRAMGGEDGIREQMRGGGGSQDITVSLSYKNLDREIARLMRSDSRTRRIVRA